MQPIHEQPTTAGEVPSSVRNAKTLMYVQGVLYILGVVMAILFAGSRRNNQDTGEATREGAAFFALLFLVIGIALIVGLFVYAGKLQTLRPDVRTKVVVLESIIAVLSLLSVLGRNVFALITLGLAIAVIVLLNGGPAKAAFGTSASTAADRGNRFDVRDFPEV